MVLAIMYILMAAMFGIFYTKVSMFLLGGMVVVFIAVMVTAFLIDRMSALDAKKVKT
jgi:hypothetical protein